MGLLKNLDPLLTADLLHVLRSMGHGDMVCVCDCNFPAAEVASKTTTGKLVILTCDLPSVWPSPAPHLLPTAVIAVRIAGAECDLLSAASRLLYSVACATHVAPGGRRSACGDSSGLHEPLALRGVNSWVNSWACRQA